MQSYSYQDKVFTFEGCISVKQTADWVMPWRIDCERLDLYPGLTERASESTGVRLVFSTSSLELALELEEPASDMKVDLFVDGLFIQEAKVDPTSNQIVFNMLPPGNKDIEIWLDHRYQTKLKRVLTEPGAKIGILPQVSVKKNRWIHYGSSISQAKEAESASKIWTGMVAQRLGLNLTNLGFAGECKLDPMIARLIRDLPADFISLEVGINIYDGDLTERTFTANLIGAIQIIKEKHYRTPLTIISPIFSPPREDVKGNSGMSLKDIRAIVADVVQRFNSREETKIQYIDGHKLFGINESQYLPDELHPDAGGQFILAINFIKEVFGSK
ncbi:MAG TPA: SGNH/GDSL hydrolase family protein [Bacillota bacterium]|jgi:lysophospholipase L1-like esterase|nr:SGNH/GDSL hydrolase family protein [Bacillota bacterium]HOL09361.1 SGNH/GDSL hydrolase family protein [Bacillota bacterium]HPO97090.1 SGNH/GDSL hydrolase family protein [Bacillota bacterium]